MQAQRAVEEEIQRENVEQHRAPHHRTYARVAFGGGVLAQNKGVIIIHILKYV